jgi:hypothetical protein
MQKTSISTGRSAARKMWASSRSHRPHQGDIEDAVNPIHAILAASACLDPARTIDATTEP